MKLNLAPESDLTRPEMENIKLRLHRVETKEISTVTLGAIANSLLTTRGDIIVRNATVPERLVLAVPSAPTINFLGVINGELQPTWKSASSAGAADAHVVQTDANGYSRLVRLGIGIDPTTQLEVVGEMRFRAASGSNAFQILNSSVPGVKGFTLYPVTDGSGLNTDLRLYQEGTGDRIAISSFGNVGINKITDITRKLDVGGDGRFTAGLICNEDGGGAATDDFRAESDTEANMLWLDASADLLYLGGSTGVKISKGGKINAPLTDYANNAAALAGGLSAGDFYAETGTDPKRVCVVY